MMRWLERVKHTVCPEGRGSSGSPRSRTAALQRHLADAAHVLDANRARLRELVTQAEQLTTGKHSAEQACSDLEHDVDIALEEDRDDLARYTLTRLLERQRMLERLCARLVRVEEEQQSLRALVLDQQTALADLQARARSVLVRSAADGVDKPEPVEDEQVELELLKRKRRRAAQHAEAKEQAHE
jgi:hypothetical protein